MSDSNLRKAADICKEMKDALDPKEELDTIDAVNEIIKEKETQWNKQELSLQDQIRELTKSCEEQAKNIIPCFSEREQENALDMLDTHQHKAANDFRSQEAALSETRTNIKQFKQEIEDLKQKKSSIKSTCNESATKSQRSTLRLYETLTSLKWDYSAPQQIKGFTANDGHIESFEFNPERYTQCFITETLWDIIGRTCHPSS
eukprot:m.51616 g.51616  ORF g.51616 m.51616 type:complete len:203 (+) comp7572_c0_seq2:70-678(+)